MAKILNDAKRRMHNGVERRRKDKINSWIRKIGDVLPVGDPKKESKHDILERAFDLLNHLKEENEKLLLGNVNDVQGMRLTH